jgi:uncharacterized membrane protein
MRSLARIVAAVAAGALATHFLDPQQGRRRRAVLRDKTMSRLGKVDEAGRVIAQDLRNRTQGTLANLWHRVGHEEVDDAVLAERVRSKLGRVVSHPGAIEVAAREGVVSLRGPVLQREVQRLMQAVWALPGVQGVEDRLAAHKQPGDVPGLQGSQARREERLDILQEHWSPATRLLVGGAGGLLAAYGLARRSPLGVLFGAAGAALATRAATNMDARRLLGQRGRRGIDFLKTIRIAAPVEELFAFWSNFENFPRFMRNVRAVRRNADGSWHWEVAGPFGTTLQWNAAVTQSIQNELIAWSTASGSQVAHAGIVRFERDGAGTRVQVEMSYNPPGGAAGHALASLFGADPGAEMDEDLMRLKAYFETGKPARDAAAARTPA